MKNTSFLTSTITILILISFNGYSQEIDQSLLKNLSPAQIELAKKQLDKTRNAKQKMQQNNKTHQVKTCSIHQHFMQRFLK